MTPPDSDRFPDSIVQTHALSQRVTTADGTLAILSDVELAVKAGETLAITGASGSGKSTLLGLLAGLDQPSSGDIFLLGQHLNTLDEDARARLRAGRIGFVFQSFQLLPALTALENILLPLELAGRAAHWLDRVGLAARAGHTPNKLSGGEQQRIAIARAFAADPQILFADEPTGNLDADTGARIIELLFDLNASAHTTLILVTHDDALASRCQRRLHLVAGHASEVAIA
ncbi:MAG: ATP-binding cassette domain-containing protein [Thiobacillus sp.]|nr:ATP-binding cassette domain-containing protein [Thiobacillus sp.]